MGNNDYLCKAITHNKPENIYLKPEMKKTIAAAALALSLLASGATATAQSPKRDFRSIWLTTYMNIDWPSETGVTPAIVQKQKNELIKYLDNHKKRNFNGVCFHVRMMADAAYRSSYEPWSNFVTGTRGQDPGWDPLAFVVEEAHKRGLECYAWVNPYRYNRDWRSRETPQDKALEAKKGWIINQGTVDMVGTKTKENEYQVFNPALPEVREYLLNVFREIYLNYRIDGMLFDDYFYPNDIPTTTKALDYVDFDEQNPGHGTDEASLKQEMGDWRRANINLLMHQLYEDIQANRPDMRFGLSPAGVAYKGLKDYPADLKLPDRVPNTTDWQYDGIFSDPLAWLSEGSVDFISPQIYWFYYPGNNSYTTAAPYDKLAQWWTTVAKIFGRHMYASLGSYRLADNKGNPIYNNESHWRDLSKQIEFVRQYNTRKSPGAIFYSSKYMDGPLCSGWGDYLQENSYQLKALVPVIEWKEAPAITAPKVTKKDFTLSWDVPEATSTSPIIRYTIYAVPEYVSKERAMAADGDGIDNRYLIDVNYTGNYSLPANVRGGHWYAVCTYDGYGNESEPAYISYPQGELPPPPAVAREEVNYETLADGTSMTNVWFRSVTPEFDNIELSGEGGLNRGIAIAGDKVYLTGRTAAATDASAYVREYDLLTGEYLRDIVLPDLQNDDSSTYPCNDICSDSYGRLYISSLSINAAGHPVTLHRFDPAKGTVELVAELTINSSPVRVPRIDHVSVMAENENKLQVYAAISSSRYVLRWTIENGAITARATMEAKAFAPSTARNFGAAARAIATVDGRVVVNGASTYPTEYDFVTGQITGSPAGLEGIEPEQYTANGFAHFGPSECYMAYPVNDYSAANGYRFAVIRGSEHGFGSGSELMWKLPQTSMGQVNSTTQSAPVAAVTSVDGLSWTSHLAVFAAGNGLAVYRIDGKNNSAVSDPAAEVAYRYEGGTVQFAEPVDVEVYNTAGALLMSRRCASVVTLPEARGIYIVRAGNKVLRLAK